LVSILEDGKFNNKIQIGKESCYYTTKDPVMLTGTKDERPACKVPQKFILKLKSVKPF